jgi:hypothetical protein
VCLFIDLHGQRDLPQVACALRAAGIFSRGLSRWQQEGQQQSDDQECNEHLDDR